MNGLSRRVDVAIVGAGMAGTCIANVLARRGCAVALVDRHKIHPPEFRAEKIGAPQMALFDGLGLGAAVREVAAAFDDTLVYRFGRLVSHTSKREYGFDYATLINRLRAELPAQVTFSTGKVTDIVTGPDRQSVVLADGTAFDARLVILATGMGDGMRRSVGIDRVEHSKGHSLSLGFTLAPPVSTFPFDALTYFGRRPQDRVAYLTLFPIEGKMRANLFAYRNAAEAWTRSFRDDPQAMLLELMPEIAELCGGFEVASPVQVRPIDMIGTKNHRRDGVVLVGDAFYITCPVPGVGIHRVLTDVTRLCTIHLPGWLETPGMAADKIGRYYDDPIKRKMDAKSIRASLFARSMTTDTRPQWLARRWRNYLVRRTILGLKTVRRTKGQTSRAEPILPPAMSSDVVDGRN